ncbi:MAG: iron-sulfur cluster repair di-iron protein [Candidatus Obscuribacterales bacterium]|nr:iron-sulfur cluster repair di-iron protein [Candidatus Obscuribacterales bacterium]
MNNFRHESVGILVAEQPLRAAVFDKLGIDFCCGGKQTLEAACENLAITVDTAIALLLESDELANDTSGDANWLAASLTELTDHIEQTHHRFLKRELPRLQTLSSKVARVHGDKDPRLLKVEAVFAAMKQEIDQHTTKEELVLFPFIRQLDQGVHVPDAPFVTVANPVRCMESEHDDAGAALMELRRLTDGYNVPEGACTSWVALLGGLAQLDQDLRIHIHKENSILFPKAIAAEGAHASVSHGTKGR